ncbi:MAG TPA: T9SS type A sorting domain-containing protein [Candidatus Kapabacteria bacterium]|nr:T9SS type A sorting domain-containing protein [Candidatus Kapabacteria bacterium]
MMRFAAAHAIFAIVLIAGTSRACAQGHAPADGSDPRLPMRSRTEAAAREAATHEPAAREGMAPGSSTAQIRTQQLFRRTPFNNDTLTICEGDSVHLTARPATIYHWDLVPGLSCYDCQTPTARPSATTTYHVTVQSALGGVFMDSLVVIVLPGGTLRAGTGPLRETEDHGVAIPILLDDEPAALRINAFTLTATYDSNALAPVDTSLLFREALTGSTLMEEWRVTLLHQEPGLLSLQFEAASPDAFLLNPGTLATLRFTRFLTEGEGSGISCSMQVPARPCLEISTADATIPSPGESGRYHLLAQDAEAFAFDQNHPNPFSETTEFDFSLPEAGHATLTLVDLTGHIVATPMDAELRAGRHRIAWDAAGLPAGAYLARFRCGSFNTTRSLILAR